MKLNVFGKEVEVSRIDDEWKVYYLGNEGKKRIANDISIPNHVPHSEVVAYISDLCHEWARPGNMKVVLKEE